jgi:hypothetical protein
MNTRLIEAIDALVSGEGDARRRVSLACSILDKMHPSELPPDINQKIEEIKNEAGKYGPLLSANGEIIRDRYENTSQKRINRTYSNLARQLYKIIDQEIHKKTYLSN